MSKIKCEKCNNDTAYIGKFKGTPVYSCDVCNWLTYEEIKIIIPGED